MVATVCGLSLTMLSAAETLIAPTASGGCRLSSAWGAVATWGALGVLLTSLSSDLLFDVGDHVLQDLVSGWVDRVRKAVGHGQPVGRRELLELSRVAGAEAVLDLQRLELA